MDALTAESLNLSLFAVTVVSVQPVAINTPWNALPLCPLNWLMSSIATVFLRSMKISEISFSMTEHYLIVCSIPFPVSFYECFLKWIKQKTLLLVSLWYFTPSEGIWNGTRISTVWYLKVDTVMMVSGVMLIHDHHFKWWSWIRYGGIYARHREIDKKLYRAISKEKHRIFRSFNQWRTAILSAFGYDPLECPDCEHTMLLLNLYYNHQHVSLEELYEKTMSKSRGKRSSAWILML